MSGEGGHICDTAPWGGNDLVTISNTQNFFLAKVLPLDQKYVSVAESQKLLEKLQMLSNILWVTCLLGHHVVDLDFGGPFG